MIKAKNGLKLNIVIPNSQVLREYSFAFVALFVLLIMIYSNSLNGAWLFDDGHNIVDNKNLFVTELNWDQLKQSLTKMHENEIASRPLAYLSFALNYYMGDLNVLGYHLVNLVIHYITSVFLFLFIYNTLRLPSLKNKYEHIAYGVALLSVVLWAINPLQTTAVTYIVQRMASMAGMFFIMAMFFYLKCRVSSKRFLFGTLCVLSTGAAFLTKENTAILPICLFFYDLLLIQSISDRSIKDKILYPVLLISVIALVASFYTDLSTLFNGYSDRPFNMIERLLTESRIIIFYISLLLYPISSRLTFIHDIEISHSLFAPWTTFASILLILLIVVTALSMIKKKSLIAYCILFFFVNHLIESTILPLELIYEHRNYIPSMLFFVPISILFIHCIDYFSYKKFFQFCIAGLVVVVLISQGHTVYARNEILSHPLLVWLDNVHKSPRLSRVHNNLGVQLFDLGEQEKAFEEFKTAHLLNRQNRLSNYSNNLFNLANYYMNISGEYDKAYPLLIEAKRLNPGYTRIYEEIALYHVHGGDLTQAMDVLKSALSHRPNDHRVHHTLSYVYLRQGDVNNALNESLLALSIKSDYFNAHSICAQAYYQNQQYDQAIHHWESYLKKVPNDFEANVALIELYYKNGNKNKLSKIIGKVLYLKGQTSWREFMLCNIAKNIQPVYIPSVDQIISIVSDTLNKQFDSQETACDGTLEKNVVKKRSIDHVLNSKIEGVASLKGVLESVEAKQIFGLGKKNVSVR